MAKDLRTLLIANPHAGGGMLGQRWSSIAAAIAAEIGQFQHRFTLAPGDATRLARDGVANGYELIVAVGGDGTVNEVLNGLFDGDTSKPAAVLGVIHFGTGGDFCRTVGVSRRLRDSARGLRGRTSRAIDVGRVRYTDHDGSTSTRYFANVASFGISGLVDALVNESPKMLGGKVTFALATIRAMRRYRAQTAVLRFDEGDDERVRLHTVAVANGQFFGGGMRIAPHARIDDGLLDIVTIDEMSALDLLRHGHRVYRGTHLDLPQVSYRQARRVDARPAQPDDRILLDIDGEAPGRLPATFELLPAALQLKTSHRSHGGLSDPPGRAGAAEDGDDVAPS